MAENAKFLFPEDSLYNVKTLQFGYSYTEYLVLGVDPITFKPLALICNSYGDVPTYVSLDGKHIVTFLFHLRKKLDCEMERNFDCRNGSGVSLELMEDGFCRLETKYGKVVFISRDSAYHLSHGKASEVISTIHPYIYDYNHYKPILKQYQMMVYEKYFANGKKQLKAYLTDLLKESCEESHILNKYFGIK